MQCGITWSRQDLFVSCPSPNGANSTLWNSSLISNNTSPIQTVFNDLPANGHGHDNRSVSSCNFNVWPTAFGGAMQKDIFDTCDQMTRLRKVSIPSLDVVNTDWLTTTTTTTTTATTTPSSLFLENVQEPPVVGRSTTFPNSDSVRSRNKTFDNRRSSAASIIPPSSSLDEQQQQVPTGNSKYKTEMCRSVFAKVPCKYGENCQFAHSDDEIRDRPHNNKYKTIDCKNFHQRGYCYYGPKCDFKHSEPSLDFNSQQCGRKTRASSITYPSHYLQIECPTLHR